MASYDVVLIDVLRQLAAGEGVPLQEGDGVDVVRAALLVVSSASLESCRAVELLGYETLEDESTGVVGKVTGLSVPSAGCHVSDIIDSLRDSSEVPAEVRSAVGQITLPEYQAALFAVSCVLRALHRTEYPLSPPDPTAEERVRALRRSLRQLHDFRRTGEP